MNKGFTLVELSIVLIIIGLLVGGVLIGQNLIESAKLSAFVSQMQQIDAAAAIFKDKYKALPGDADLARVAIRGTGGPMTPKIRDGILCDDDCSAANFWSNTEAQNFWYELNVLGGVKFENCKTFSTQSGRREMVTSGPNCNVPTAKLGEKAMIFIHNTSNNPALNINYYVIADCSGMQRVPSAGFFNDAHSDTPSNRACWRPYTGGQAYAYDNKVDDGSATTGNVVASVKNMVYPNSSPGGLSDTDGDQTIGGSQSSYNVSSQEPTHNLMQVIGTQ